MAMAQVERSDTGATMALVSAAPGKLLVVKRLIFTAGVSGNIRLQSDAGGAGEADITPKLYLAGNRILDLGLGRVWGVATGRGASLGFTTAMAISGSYTVVVWYEVTD
jgi:hypothetical protein